MAFSQGANYPSTITTGGANGFGDSWTNPNNAKLPDGNAAFFGFPNGGESATDLIASNFGFSIPATATITGVVAEILRSGSSAEDVSVNIGTSGKVSTAKLNGSWPTSSAWTTYGSSTDLWGQTWTVSDVNSTGFYLDLLADNVTGGGSASVDAMRLTVYYSMPIDPSIRKRSIAKVYRNGLYRGMLPLVVDDLEFTDEINTIGSQTTIQVATSADVAAQTAVDTLDDETGTPLQTEDGSNITIESSSSLVAIGNNNNLIVNGNTVEVWEYSRYYPNGYIALQGKIDHWQEDLNASTVTVYINGIGDDANNFILNGPPVSLVADQQSTGATSNYVTISTDDSGGYTKVGQSFTTGVAFTKLGAISFGMAGVATITLNVYTDSGLGTLLSSVRAEFNEPTGTSVAIAFSNRLTVTAATSYFFTLSVDAGESANIYYYPTNNYSGGQMYTATYGGGGGGSFSANTGQDLSFATYSTTGATTVVYTTQDPSNMLTQGIADYRSRGGLLSAGTIDSTAVSVPYTFTMATITEFVDKIRELQPANYYYYVDPGTGVLTSKATSTTADYTLIKGYHIDTLTITPTIEQLYNIFYFTGGVIGQDTTDPSNPKDINFYKVYQDTASIALYGQRIYRKTDNHVTVTATADAIASAFINEHKDEKYAAEVTIDDSKADISLYRPGKTVSFRGFGDYKDTLVLQIMRRNVKKRQVTLSLGFLPMRQSDLIQQINSDLIAQQTVDNPTVPS